MFTALRASIVGLALLMAAPVSAAGIHSGTSAATSTSTSTGYSGASAAAYADTHWSSYNKTYPSFANKGGDCTNFVSQSIYAGGIQMRTSPTYSGNAAWYMLGSRHGSWSWSVSWINAQDNSIFLLQHLPGVTQVATYYGSQVGPGQTPATNASQGDVVLYDWNNDGVFDHEAIISASDGKNSSGTTNWDLVDAHTNNRYHQYWTLSAYNTQWATTRVIVLHIPSTTY
jgi:Putative amidase domain